MMPNPALRAFEVLVGDWQTTGTHPYLPGTQLHGRTSFAWLEDGAFLIMRSELDHPQLPSGVAILGSDEAAGTFTMLYFDSRGVSRKYEVTMVDNVLVWERDEAGFAQRNTISVNSDGTTMTAKGEMSRDGGEWEGDLSVTYVRDTPDRERLA